MCFPGFCLGELERTNSTQKDVWSSGRASPACKMLTPNLGRKKNVPILFRSDPGVVLQCPVLITCFSLLLFPVFPLFVQRKPEGPRHTPSTMEIPEEQLLQTRNSWEGNTGAGCSCALLQRGKLLFPNRGCSFPALRYF